MPNAVAGVYLYCKQLTGEEEDDCTGYVRRVTHDEIAEVVLQKSEGNARNVKSHVPFQLG
jgi:hypothetical protein